MLVSMEPLLQNFYFWYFFLIIVITTAPSWMRPPSEGFSRINVIQEKIIYFYCLSVNYNNRWPAVGNDSQNGIHCQRQATIIYGLTNNNIMNNSVAHCSFIMTIIMLFSYGYARHKIDNRKKWTCFASHYVGHAYQGVRCRAHHPVRQVSGYPRRHWTPPLGE